MKKLHLLNIGFPKTGTTWLFRQIEKQSWFDQKNITKEINLIEKDQSFNQYISKYNNYNYTANFNPNLYMLGSSHVKLLHKIRSSSVSITLRNPFEQLVSYYYFSKLSGHGSPIPYENKKDLFQWTDDFLETKSLSNYSKIIDRWMQYFSNLKIFLYDDLRDNPIAFFEKYSNEMNLPECRDIDPTPIFTGNYTIDPADLQKFRRQFRDKIYNICLDLTSKKHINKITMEKWFDNDRHL